MLSVGIVVLHGRADAQIQSRNPFDAPINDDARPAVRRPTAQPVSQDAVSPSAESPRSSHHKTWKELARAHNEEKSREPGSPSPSLSPWTAVGALTVVVCLILVLARIFRRHAPLFSQTLPTEALEVLGRRFLDQRQSIVLLRIGSRILVVGSSATGLQGIGELSDPIEVDLLAGMCRGNKGGQGIGTSFLSLLKGQTASQTKPRARQESSRRTEARRPEVPIADERPSDRLSDPQHELMRRLRAGSTAGVSHSDEGEVFRG